MNAFNTVNLAGAVVLTSTDFAKQLGVDQSRWIYPLGAAGTQDSGDCKQSTLPLTYALLTMASLASTKLPF